jgi:hypothetical protein
MILAGLQGLALRFECFEFFALTIAPVKQESNDDKEDDSKPNAYSYAGLCACRQTTIR